MKSNYKYKETLIIPTMIGLFIGLLMASENYIIKILVSFTQNVHSLRLFPFEVPLVICLLGTVIFVFVLNINRMNMLLIEKREKVFIILLIAGLHLVGIIPGKIDTSDLIFGALIVWWLVTVFVDKGYKISGAPLHFLNIAMLMTAILSMTHGGVGVIFSMLPLVKAIVFSFFITDIVRRKEWTVYFIKTLFVITAISALIGIFQEFVFLYNGTLLFKVDPKILKLILEPTTFGTFLRIPAYTGMHLFLANYLVISLLIGLNAFLYLKDDLTEKEKLFLKVAMMLMFVALILTFSKTNMIGLAAGVTLSVLIKWPQRLIHFVMVLLLIVVGSYYVPGLWDKVYNHIVSDMELGGDMGLRVQLMRRGVEGFLYRYPLLGAGVGRGTEYTQDAFGWGTHNAFILAADDVGIFGFFVFLSLFVYAFIRIITTIPVTKNLDEKTILKALLAGFIAYTVNIQFQPDFLSYYTWIFLGLMEGATGLFRKMHLGAA
jgi:hypothetical protein